MRIMYDSVTPTDIPASAQMVAGYVDGAYAWPDSGWKRFPSARKVGITMGSGTLGADVADVENGDYTPATAAAWLKAKIARDGHGALYFSRGLFGAVHAATVAAGISDDHWTVWAADWTGAEHVLPGTYATQYDHPPHSGGHFDLSAVADYWPGVDPPPAVAPPTQPVSVPPPQPPTAGAGSSNLDQARLAWAALGQLLTQVIPDAIIRIEQAGNDLKKLP